MDATGVHHKVIVKTCNTQISATGEAACGRQAGQVHAAAEVGAFILINPTAYEDNLIASHVADLADFSPTSVQYSTPNTFQIMYGNNQGGCASSAFLNSVKSPKKVAMVATADTGSQNIGNTVDQILTREGYTPVRINEPQTTTDFSSVVQQVESSGAKVVIFAGTTVPDSSFMLSANGAGDQFTYCVGDGVWTTDQLKKLGAVADNFYSATWWPEMSEAPKYPLMQQFLSELKAEYATGDTSATPSAGWANLMNGWLGMQAFKQVVKTMQPPITSAAVWNKLKTSKVTFGGLMPNIDFAKPRGAGAYPRVFNPTVIMVKWNPSSGEYDGTSLAPINVINLQYGK